MTRKKTRQSFLFLPIDVPALALVLLFAVWHYLGGWPDL